MSGHSRLPAVVVYLFPVVGWLYVWSFQRKNPLAMYHLRQVIGLLLFLAGTVVGWAVVAWILAWLPYLAVLSIALFTLVIAAFLFGAVTWVVGLIRAVSSRATPLPAFGRWAERLPIR